MKPANEGAARLKRQLNWTLGAFGLGLATVSGTRVATVYKAIDLDATNLDIGVVAGAFGILAVIAAIPIGRAVDRLGERTFFLSGLVLIPFAALVALWASSLFMLVISQAVLGLGQALLAISMQTIAAHGETPMVIDQRFAGVAMMQSLAQLVGPTVAGLAIEAGRSAENAGGGGLTYVIAAIAGGVGVIIAVFVVSSTSSRLMSRPRKPVGITAMLRGDGVVGALLASMSVLVSIDILVAYLPVIGQETGISPGFIGLLLSIRAAAGLAARPAVTPLLRWLGRRRLLVTTLIVMAGAMGLIPFLTHAATLLVLVSVLGFGINLGAPLTASWVAGSVQPEAKGAALAMRMTANRLAQIVVPSILGLIAVGAGTASLFVAAGVGLLSTSQGVRRASLEGEGPTSGEGAVS